VRGPGKRCVERCSGGAVRVAVRRAGAVRGAHSPNIKFSVL